jgi:hypothetical protein
MALEMEGLMHDWSVPLETLLDGLTIPQFKLLSWARVQRVKSEREWQMNVASLPLQENPQDFYNEVLGLLDSGASGDDSGGSRSHSRAPLLHEIDPGMAAMMGLPIRYVERSEDGDG